MALAQSKITVEDLPDDHLLNEMLSVNDEVHRALTDSGGSILMEHAAQGDDVNVVQIFTIGGQKFIHKESTSPPNIVSETVGTRLCRQAGVNAPEVLFSGSNTLLETFIGGKPLDAEDLGVEEIRLGYRELGLVFRKLHARQVQGFGLFRSEDQNEYDTFQEYVRCLKERNLSRATSSGLFTTDQLGEIEELFDHHINATSTEKPVLTHQDIGPQNVHVEGGRIVGLIDFADCQGSVPAADLARLYVQKHLMPEEPPYFDLVMETYGEINRDQLRLFVVLRLIKCIIYDSPKVGREKMHQVLNKILHEPTLS